MTKNEHIIFNLRKIFSDINEKWFIRFSIITGNGKDKNGARIVKYDEANDTKWKHLVNLGKEFFVFLKLNL